MRLVRIGSLRAAVAEFGAGCATKLIFSWGGNPGVLRGYVGTDLAAYANIAPITCPFTGERLTAVPALRPDVTIIHAQQADRAGNVLLWGIMGVQKEAVLAARRAIVTVEEVVDTLVPGANSVVLPHWVLAAVCEVPGGAHPSFAIGYSERDNEFYRAWEDVSRDRDRFEAWIKRHVFGTSDHAGFLASIEARTRGEGRFRLQPRQPAGRVQRPRSRHQPGDHRPGRHGTRPQRRTGVGRVAPRGNGRPGPTRHWLGPPVGPDDRADACTHRPGAIHPSGVAVRLVTTAHRLPVTEQFPGVCP